MIKFKTKKDAIYETLRKGIIDGKFMPGEKLNISELSRTYEVSNIPIREAMERLKAEGFIQHLPHNGIIVSKINKDDFIEIYMIRTEVESLAAKLAVRHMTESDINYLQEKIEEMKRALKSGNYNMLGALNKDFHLKIYSVAPYPYLNKLIVELWEKVHRTQGVFAFVPERAAASIKEHEQIVNAIRGGKTLQVTSLIRKQKKESLKALNAFLSKDNNYSKG